MLQNNVEVAALFMELPPPPCFFCHRPVNGPEEPLSAHLTSQGPFYSQARSTGKGMCVCVGGGMAAGW